MSPLTAPLQGQPQPDGRGQSARPDQSPPEVLRLLIVEDNAAYAALIAEMVGDGWRGPLDVAYAGGLDEARAHLLKANVDCVLLDMVLPDSRGCQGVAEIRELAPELPIVVVSGLEDEDLAVRAVDQGADDYILKSYADANLLSRAIRYAVQRKKAELEVTHRGLHDSLTGLPNRTLFDDRLEQALTRSERSDRWVAVLFLDVDRFKPINDSFGHDAGDQVLVEVAARLAAMLRPSDTVARFGGDEFMMLCEELESEHQAVDIAQRVQTTMSEPIWVRRRRLSVTTSIGIALVRGAHVASANIVRDADLAMYRAKETGSGFALADKWMQESALGKLELEDGLSRAVREGELRLLYQPQVRLDSGHLFGVEALVRWEHPQRGLLEPAEFLELAEQSDLILDIGSWVLQEACAQLVRWHAEFPDRPKLTVSVNVSAREITEPGFPEVVGETLRRTGVDPAHVALEVTETAVVGDIDSAAKTTAGLKRLGVALSVDDFGTGYSSLSLLSRCPVDGLKIDREFVRNMAVDPRGGRMVAGLMRLAGEMGLEVIAEGIEDGRQPGELQALGCGLGQGHLFRGAQTAEAISRLISEGATLTPDERGARQ